MEFKSYFTVLVPWVPTEFRTPWHPTVEGGSFSVLSRGAFLTKDEALRWGREHLGGMPYSIRFVPDGEGRP